LNKRTNTADENTYNITKDSRRPDYVHPEDIKIIIDDE
jgi:hypothetical protein